MARMELSRVVRRPLKQQALLAAVCAAGMLAGSVQAAETYTWSGLSSGTFNWNDNTHWTDPGTPNVAGYPGGDAAILDDAAVVTVGSSLGGNFTLNYAGMTAPSIASLTLTANGTSTTADSVTFNVNSTLGITGLFSATSSATNAPITSNFNANTTIGGTFTSTANTVVNIGNNAVVAVTGATSLAAASLTIGSATLTTSALTLTTGSYVLNTGGKVLVGGTVGNSNTAATINLTGADSYLQANSLSINTGSFNVQGAGSLTLNTLTSSSSATFGNSTLNTSGTVKIGTITLGRSLSGAPASDGSSQGLHITNGTLNVTDFLDGNANSNTSAEIGGSATVNVSGQFLVSFGANGNSTRATALVLSSRNSGNPTLNYTNTSAPIIVGRCTADNVTGVAGIFQINGGVANVEGIQLGGATVGQFTGTSSATNRGSLVLTGGTLNLGSQGLVGITQSYVSATQIGSAYAVSISGGTLGAKANWSTSTNMTLTNSPTVRAGDGTNSFNIALNGNLTGTGGITKTGGGTLTLTGAGNAYTGATTVNEGTLIVSSKLANSTVTVNSGATFGGIGSYDGSLTVNSGGHLAPGVPGTNSGVGLMTFTSTNNAGVTLNDGSFLDMEFNTTPAANDAVKLNSGNLTVSGSVGVSAYVGGTTLPVIAGGTYTLFTFASAANFLGSASNFHIINTGTNNAANYGFQLIDNGTNGASQLVLTVLGALAGNNWTNTTANSDWGTAGNWSSNAVPSGAGVAVTFGSAAASAGLVQLNGDKTVGGITFDNLNVYTIAQGSGGSLTLDNTPNASNAQIVLSNGSHVISAPVNLNSTTDLNAGTGTLTISGNITSANGAGLNGSSSGTTILSGDVNIVGTVTIPASANFQIGNGGTTGTLTSPSIVDSGTLRLNRSDAFSVDGLPITGAGTLVNQGTGTMTLTGNSSFAGTVRANSGKIIINDANSLSGSVRPAGGTITLASGATIGTAGINITAGTFDINGNGIGASSLAGAGLLDNTSATAATLTLSQSSNTTYSGVIANSGGGTLTLVKGGTGALTISGQNTFAGDVLVNAGSLHVTTLTNAFSPTTTVRVSSVTGLTLGAGVDLSSPINLTSTLGANEFVNVDASGAATLSGPLTINGSTQYRLSTTNTGASLTVTGTHNAASTIPIINRGTITFASNGSLITNANNTNALMLARGGALSLTLRDNALLSDPAGIDVGNNQAGGSLTFTMQDNAQVNLGTGNWNLNRIANTGANATYNLNGGSITVGSFSRSYGTASRNVTMNFNGTTIVATKDTSSFLPSVSGDAGSITMSTAIKAGGAKFNTQGFSITAANPLVGGAGDGGLAKTGTGTLTLSGAANYTGPTTIEGRLMFSGSVAHAIGNVTGNELAVDTGSTVTLAAASGTSKVTALTIAGSSGAWAGKLDITNNVVAVQSADAPSKSAALSNLANQVVSGNNGGSWNGNGITSSSNAGQPNATLVVADNSDLGWTSSGTQTLDANSLVVTRAIIGDINLDGNVDLADYDKWYKNVGTGTAYSYAAGDVNMDGTIDLGDYDLWYKHVGAAPLTLASQAALGGGVSAVPEPASLAVLSIGSVMLLRGRRRRH